MRNIDWDQLRIFLAVARARSFTKAAQNLSVSVPTASRTIVSLETAIGSPLFERLPSGLALTDAGNAILQIAEGIEREASGIGEAIASIGQTKRTVRITAIASIATFLARHLTLETDGPAIEIINSADILSLARREADIALRMRRYPAEGEVFVRRMCTLRFSVYASVEHGRSLEPTIGFSKDAYPSTQGSWLDALSPNEPAFRFSDTWLRYEATVSGKGSTVLPCFLGDADRRLCRLMKPPKELDEDVFLLVHSSQRSNVSIRHAIERVTNVFKAHQAALEGELTSVPGDKALLFDNSPALATTKDSENQPF